MVLHAPAPLGGGAGPPKIIKAPQKKFRGPRPFLNLESTNFGKYQFSKNVACGGPLYLTFIVNSKIIHLQQAITLLFHFQRLI